MSDDRRKTLRFIPYPFLPWTVVVAQGASPQAAKIADIGAGGLSVVLPQPLSCHGEVGVSLYHPSFSTPFKAPGKICNQEAWRFDAGHRHGMSLSFTETQQTLIRQSIDHALQNLHGVLDRRRPDRLRNALRMENPWRNRIYQLSKEPYAMTIRQLTNYDLDDLCGLENAVWGNNMGATREMFQSRMEVFPEGLIGIYISGKLWGYINLIMIKRDEWQKDFSWMEITDRGFIKGTHNHKGDCLYGISFSVLPGAPKEVPVLLVKAANKLGVRKGLQGTLFGSRVPSYHKHASSMSIEDYVKALSHKGRAIDPELHFYHQFQAEFLRHIPHYFEDPESLNYGVLIFVPNPFFNFLTRNFPYYADSITVQFT